MTPDKLPPGFPAAAETTRSRRYLTALIAGTAEEPPVVGRLALPPAASWQPGRLVSTAPLEETVTLTEGIVFGGYISCLVDHYAGLAMMTVLPDDAAFLTAGMEVSFHAPLHPGQSHVEAAVTRLSSRHAMVEVTFTQDARLASRGVVEQIIRRGVHPKVATAAEPSGAVPVRPGT